MDYNGLWREININWIWKYLIDRIPSRRIRFMCNNIKGLGNNGSTPMRIILIDLMILKRLVVSIIGRVTWDPIRFSIATLVSQGIELREKWNYNRSEQRNRINLLYFGFVANNLLLYFLNPIPSPSPLLSLSLPVSPSVTPFYTSL